MRHLLKILPLVLVALPLLGNPMSITLATNDSETTQGIVEALNVWAVDPTSLTACSGDCCNGTATDAECTSLAREILQGRSESVARSIFPCIQASSAAFACEWWADSDGTNRMVCETFPSAVQALVDSAVCASKLSATRF